MEIQQGKVAATKANGANQTTRTSSPAMDCRPSGQHSVGIGWNCQIGKDTHDKRHPDSTTDKTETFGKPAAKKAEKVLAGGKPKTGPPTAPLLEVSLKKPPKSVLLQIRSIQPPLKVKSLDPEISYRKWILHPIDLPPVKRQQREFCKSVATQTELTTPESSNATTQTETEQEEP
ncbi:hypothetical protein PUN28_011838 [Cardiocondyla obscurior]|uniref:Uncharacterized protein n=1 Tax=Cardiocondyla obscurior TaxID=286306 RepID=A0AAW2FLJ6_9HYME